MAHAEWLNAIRFTAAMVGAACALGSQRSTAAPPVPKAWIGYTEYRANLDGGRQANVSTMRACTVRADGTGRRVLAEELTEKPDTWTQFAGWSPDGRLAIIGNGWESPENARWEEEHKTFRFTPESWLNDMHLLDMASGKLTNITAVERVSYYNSGLFFWPKQPDRLGFQAMVEGTMHPFAMDRDGRNKTDLTKGSKGFAYGFSAAPDGKLIAYHQDYQVYIANVDGSNARQVTTGQPFNFVPQWSPDGQWLMFISGEHYHCHPYVVRRDGTGLKKLADRNGYRGVVTFLDVFDFHGGSSDVPAWSPDGRWIYYTAKVDDRVELMRVSLDGSTEQLTRSEPGSLHYHPQPSPDGQWVVFGSKQGGVRQIHVMRPETREQSAITQMQPGWGAMWPHWQPDASAPRP